MAKSNSSQRPLYWAMDLQGMNQRQDVDKIPDNCSPWLENICLDKPSSWSKRKGSRLLGTNTSVLDFPDALIPSSAITRTGSESYTYTQHFGDLPGYIYISQGFATPSGNHYLKTINLYMSNGDSSFVENTTAFGAIKTRHWYIMNDNSGEPGTTVVASGHITQATCTTNTIVTIPNLSLTLTPSTTYHLVVMVAYSNSGQTPGSNTTTQARCDINNTNPYAGGKLNYSEVSIEFIAGTSVLNGTTWNAVAGTDLCFSLSFAENLTSYPKGARVIEYQPYSGVNVKHRSNYTDLDIYDDATDSWSTSVSNAFNGTSDIEACNYINRVYWVGENDELQWENGTGSMTIVGTPDNTIKGKTIANVQNTLFVGNVNEVSEDTVDYQDRIYYSLFSKANNNPSDQLYQSNPIETIDISTRWFSVLAPVRALWSFSTTGLLYIFTDFKCFQFDMRYAVNSVGPTLMFNYGACSPRAVTECNGWMVWMDNEARIWGWSGTGVPVPFSWDIDDDDKNEALINLIDPDNLSKVCAGNYKNKFYFSVGDITYKDTLYENCVITGLLAQNFQTILWEVSCLPVQPGSFYSAFKSGIRALIFSDILSADVYQFDKTIINDANTAISGYGKTKFFDFNMPFNTSQNLRLYVKYKPQPAPGTYLRVRFSVDGDFNYTTLSDPDSTLGSPVTMYGVIDMYDRNNATKIDAVKMLQFPNIARGRTLSIEVGNEKLNEDFEIKGIGIEFVKQSIDLNPETV